MSWGQELWHHCHFQICWEWFGEISLNHICAQYEEKQVWFDVYEPPEYSKLFLFSLHLCTYTLYFLTCLCHIWESLTQIMFYANHGDVDASWQSATTDASTDCWGRRLGDALGQSEKCIVWHLYIGTSVWSHITVTIKIVFFYLQWCIEGDKEFLPRMWSFVTGGDALTERRCWNVTLTWSCCIKLSLYNTWQHIMAHGCINSDGACFCFLK